MKELESLRSIARRLVADYRRRHGIVNDAADASRYAVEAIFHPDHAPADRFYMRLTAKDRLFLKVMRIQP